ncbi:DUF2029 domain-containing protein, partial [Mycobacterium tuberculosis]|nr:DUF2029 domain-containing protein [Mycobacterium tuberculosis]
MQTALFGQDVGYRAFFYPPPFLAVVLPFGLLPYGAAVVAWIGATSAAAVLLLRRQAPNLALLGLLAMPALWLNGGHGQNGALTLA